MAEPYNWKREFNAAYGSVMDSEDFGTARQLADFRKTVILSFRQALISEPDCLDELLNRTAELTRVTAGREERLRRSLKAGFQEAQLKQAMYLLGNGAKGEDPLEAYRRKYQTEICGSLERMGLLRDTVSDLADMLTEFYRPLDCAAFQRLVSACDEAAGIDAGEAADVSDYQQYTAALLKFAALKRKVLPDSESTALDRLKQRATAIAESKQGNTAKGKEILQLISEWEEQQTAERRAAYWAAHADEKAELEAEQTALKGDIQQLDENINRLTAETDSLPSMQAVRTLDGQLAACRRELKGLGLLQMKKKKELQAEITRLLADRAAAWDASKEDRDAMEKEAEPFREQKENKLIRMQQIENRLSCPCPMPQNQL